MLFGSHFLQEAIANQVWRLHQYLLDFRNSAQSLRHLLPLNFESRDEASLDEWASALMALLEAVE